MQPPDELRDPSRASGWLNKLLSFAKSNQLVEGVGYRLLRTTRGTALEIQAGGGGKGSPGNAKRFLLRSVHEDHLLCDAVDGEPGVIVAKDHQLRRTGWHGVTVAYALELYPGSPVNMSISYNYVSPTYRIATVTSGPASAVEHQVIIPRYVPNLTIIKAMEFSNGTGVSGADWMELGQRSWARIL